MKRLLCLSLFFLTRLYAGENLYFCSTTNKGIKFQDIVFELVDENSLILQQINQVGDGSLNIDTNQVRKMERIGQDGQVIQIFYAADKNKRRRYFIEAPVEPYKGIKVLGITFEGDFEEGEKPEDHEKVYEAVFQCETNLEIAKKIAIDLQKISIYIVKKLKTKYKAEHTDLWKEIEETKKSLWDTKLNNKNLLRIRRKVNQLFTWAKKTFYLTEPRTQNQYNVINTIKLNRFNLEQLKNKFKDIKKLNDDMP